MENLQFDTFLWKIHGIVAEIHANTPDIALARFIFPTPFRIFSFGQVHMEYLDKVLKEHGYDLYVTK